MYMEEYTKIKTERTTREDVQNVCAKLKSKLEKTAQTTGFLEHIKIKSSFETMSKRGKYKGII